MRVFTAAGSIHIEHDEPFESSFVAGYRLEPGLPIGTVCLVPVIHDGDLVRHALTGQELARRIGVITDIGTTS